MKFIIEIKYAVMCVCVCIFPKMENKYIENSAYEYIGCSLCIQGLHTTNEKYFRSNYVAIIIYHCILNKWVVLHTFGNQINLLVEPELSTAPQLYRSFISKAK